MSLKRHEITASGAQGGAMSHAQFGVEQATKIKRTYQKRKEGTEGITATDERSDQERMEEYRDLMGGYDD